MKRHDIEGRDGSLHRFAAEGGGYLPAPGSFMRLTHAGGEYRVERKDNITYHFDDGSMQLKSFSDAHGNSLKLTYDGRGNIAAAMNTVGDKLEFEYNVMKDDDPVEGVDHGAALPMSPNPPSAGALGSDDPDYPYVNDHVDMLKSVRYTPVEGTSIIYGYEYDEFDRMTKADFADSSNTHYTEVMAYGTKGRLNRNTK
jgi:YD repeat-containing protein